MKTVLKNWLSQNGILPKLDAVRRASDTLSWLANGCTGVAPPPVKRRVLKSYLQKHGLSVFIETGTHLGDTVAAIAFDENIECTSVELDSDLYNMAQKRFDKWKNVSIVHGDSGKVIPELVHALQKPALFWLDGHYSGGKTAKSDAETPISEELSAILESKIRSHVVLIDDARCFDGTQGYPHLDQLLESVRMNSDYRIEVSADIIRMTPRNQEI